MAENIFEKFIEHNNWANREIVQDCLALSDAQLDAEPRPGTYGSIRQTLLHLVSSQQGYLSLLTVPVETRRRVPLAFDRLQESARISGEGLLAQAKDTSGQTLTTRLQTMDGFFVEPWVVLVQVINHATEHREQIKGMLSLLGVTPPELDGWGYGEVTHALIPISS